MPENFTFGLCVWDVPAAIAFVGVAFILFNQQRNHRKRMKNAARFIESGNKGG